MEKGDGSAKKLKILDNWSSVNEINFITHQEHQVEYQHAQINWHTA